MRRPLLVLLAAVSLSACQSDDPPEAAPACHDAQGGRVTVVADDTRWDTDCLRTPAGAVTIVVDNRDDGVNHNIHLPDAPGSPATDLVQGPAIDELDVSLEPGEYEYVCDIHPNMVGTLTVG